LTSNYFDGVLACRSLIHISHEDINDVIMEIARLLKDQGKFGIMLSIVPKAYEGFEKEEYDNSLQTFFHHYDLNEIETLLNKFGFIVDYKNIEKHIDEDSKREVQRLTMICNLNRKNGI
jgi:ubiquinone/menaquinone biosynthesis C-methylase UbiE